MVERIPSILPPQPVVKRAGTPEARPSDEGLTEEYLGTTQAPEECLSPPRTFRPAPPSFDSLLPVIAQLTGSVSVLPLKRDAITIDRDQIRIMWAQCLFPHRPPPQNVGPLGAILHLQEDGLANLPRKKLEVERWADGQRAFQEEWKAAEQDLDQLRAMEARWSRRPLTAEQRTHLLRSFMNHGAFGDAVDFYERSVTTEPAFARYESPREDFIVALNKTGQSSRAIREAQTYLAERGYPSEADNGDKLQLALNARLLGGLGKSFKSIHQQAEELIDRCLIDSPVIRLTETLTGQPLDESQQRQVLSSARDCLQGEATVYELAERIEAATGAMMTAVVPMAALKTTVKELERSLTRDHRIDPDLVAVTEETSGRSIGTDLLKLSRVSDQLSHQYFRAGFEVDFEYYAGLETVYDRLLAGDEAGAQRLADVVDFSCDREDTREYFGLATRMELALIRGHWDRAVSLLPEVADAAEVGWNLKSTLSNLKKLSHHCLDQGRDTAMIDFVRASLEARLGAGVGPHSTWTEQATHDLREQGWSLAAGLPRHPDDPSPNPCRLDGTAPVTHLTTGKLLHKTFHFKSVNSKMVGGNFSFGGALPDITVNQTDILTARGLLRMMDLEKTDDFTTWNQRVDELLQERFGLEDERGRRPLEDLDSPEHKKLDEFRESLLELTAASRSGSSRTNLMLELFLGHGDCRQVAYSKQLLYDVWKRDRQNQHLKSALRAVEDGHHRSAERSLAAARALERQQLATVSVTIEAPIALRNGEKYKLEKDEHGHPVPGPWQPIEDHTFNVLMEFDDQGTLKPDGLRAKDAFYRNLYPLADQPLDPVQAIGPTGLDAGFMGPPDAQGGRIPFKLRFTGYSGTTPQPNHGESGQTLLGGTPVTPPPSYKFFLGRAAAAHTVEGILDSHRPRF